MNQCARTSMFSPDGSQIAVGTNEGFLLVFSASDLSRVASVDLNEFSKQQLTNVTGSWIQAMHYSPDGKWLAVGTHGCIVAICDVNDGYKCVSVLKDHTAVLIHLDWSADSKNIQSVSKSYELLYHDIDGSDPKNSKHNTHGPAKLRDTQWATQTCIFGWGVQGLLDKNDDPTEVNCCDRAPDSSLVASGDDFGYVNLFRYPACRPYGPKSRSSGHSSHVMQVRWSPDQSYLASVGGNDKTLIIWNIVAAK